jgi:hypothetical protein
VITEAILTVILGVPAWLLAQLPSISVPTFFSSGTGAGTVGGYVQGFAGYLGAMNNWFPFDQLGTALLFIVAAVGVTTAIKVARIVASFATLGGGSAA